MAPTERMRLQKFLSDAGVASRRRAEELIRAGHVLVNEEIVDALPAFVDPRTDRVRVGGRIVKAQRFLYFLVHKPKGFVCTNRDPEGRPRAVDLLPEGAGRLFSVGRLDVDSTGLLLMTNDGELGERLTHPRYGVPKTYHAEVRGRISAEHAVQLKAGIHLAEGKAHAAQVELLHSGLDRSALMITLHEGRNRQVRRMLARLGHKVRRLKRTHIGPLSIRGLPVGACRQLSDAELEALRRLAEQGAVAAADARRGTRRTPSRRSGPSKKRSAPTGKSPVRPPRGTVAPPGRTPGGRRGRDPDRDGPRGPQRRVIY